MQFSKLRLLGFKSFVDPIELDILSGLTGIVGPNGCGKSNLLEALRWVMGENRPSSIRGGAMEDVIFAGTGTRPAKNFAEVLVCLNNLNQAPTRLDAENGSVEIVRRVTRDVGSSYRLNGKDVRAKDISMLFADSSTGAHSPSLVRQGQITELINANPKSRRRLLEEAAGISGLYQRRHEAELKLKSSEGNTLRLQDVIEQLENQIKVLKKQAREASKYEDIANDIRTNEAFLFSKKWINSEKKMLIQFGALNEKIKLSSSAELELISSSKKRQKVEELLPELRNNETRATSALQRLIVEKEGIEKEQDRAVGAIVELKTRVEEISKDFMRQNNLISDANEVIERLNWESRQLESLSLDEEDGIKKSQEEASLTAQKLIDDELKLDNDSGDFARLSGRFQNVEKQRDKAKENLEKIILGQKRSEEYKVVLTDELNAKQKEHTIVKVAFKKCKEETKIAEDSLQAIEKMRIEVVNEESEKRSDFSIAEGKLIALRAEQNAIKELILSVGSGTDQILDEVKIAKGYERALGAAFSDDIKAPIIFSNDKSGWFHLPDFDEVYSLPAGLDAISDKVTAPDAMKRRLSNIGVVDPVEGPKLQKLLKAGQKLVSKDGSLWRWDGYCCIGDDNFSEATVRLKQENRLTDLLAEITNLENKLELLRANLNLAQDKKTETEQAETSARVLRSKSDEKQSEVSRMVNSVESEVSILNSKLHSLDESLKSMKQDQQDLESEILSLNNIYESLADLGVQKHLLEQQRSVVEQSRELMVEKRARFDQVRRDSEARSQRKDELEDDLKNWEQRLILANESLTELDERRVAVDKELIEAKLQPESLLNRREKLVELVRLAEIHKAETSEELSEKESNLRLSITEERKLSQKVSGLREDVVRATAIKEHTEFDLSDLRKVIKEKTGTIPEELVKSLPVSVEELPEVLQIESELVLLKNKRESLGAVNLRAAEDSKELIEEWEDLTKEKLDLETAITKLRSAIISLNSEGRSRLLEAFQNVNNNFGKLFETLFGGGSAKLTFIESDDPLDAGLEIICQPPGKKLTTLSLLSGGEQTLTALALIFAVFKANPSPICVLDEVDAPLDDANVERFCGLLDEMVKTTQTRFMIITHHPLTMARMDRLYGVTMVERGVSQLVSVDLKKAEQLVDF